MLHTGRDDSTTMLLRLLPAPFASVLLLVAAAEISVSRSAMPLPPTPEDIVEFGAAIKVAHRGQKMYPGGTKLMQGTEWVMQIQVCKLCL